MIRKDDRKFFVVSFSSNRGLGTIKYLGNEDWTIIINQTGPANADPSPHFSRATCFVDVILSWTRVPLLFLSLHLIFSSSLRYVQKWRTNRMLGLSDTLDFSTCSQGGRCEQFLLAALWYRCFNYAAWPKLVPKVLMDVTGKKKMNSQRRVKILKTMKRVILGRGIVLSLYYIVYYIIVYYIVLSRDIKKIYNDKSK